VLGTGGAGRAVALTCAKAGAVAIALTDADPARQKSVAAEISRHFPAVKVSIGGDAKAADLIVQATPLGMKTSDASPMESGQFRAGQCAFDLVYMYPETAFMAAARKGGAQAANGLGMLLHQGAKALALWTGVEPPVDVMRKALEEAVYK
jgi:shikimate dehydrogenase